MRSFDTVLERLQGEEHSLAPYGVLGGGGEGKKEEGEKERKRERKREKDMVEKKINKE